MVNTVYMFKCLCKNVSLKGEIEDIRESEELIVLAKSLGRQK